MIKISAQMMKVAAGFAFGVIIGLILLTSLNGNQADDNLAASNIRKTGGLGEARMKDDDVAKAVDMIKPQLEEKTKTKYESIEVLNYRSQVVAGKNYFVKVKVKAVDGPESIMHLRIYKDLRDNYELTQYQDNKTENEELKYFQ